MRFDLTYKQKQQLIMTPRLRQAIALLQMPSFELESFLEEACENNPLLEFAEAEQGEREQVTEEEKFEIDWEEYFSDSSDLGHPVNGVKKADSGRWYENVLSRPETLEEHLLEQLHTERLTERECRIGEFLIGNIDSNGFLRVTLDEAARVLGIRREEVAGVLQVIKHFDPPGVGALDVRECLEIQLEELKGEYPEDLLLLAREIIKNYLEKVSAGHIAQIAGALGKTAADVQRTVDLIRTLDPKPGRQFGGSEPRFVVPDAEVKKVSGTYIVSINDTACPRLVINPFYRSLLEDKKGEAVKYLKGKLDNANFIIRCIEQRRLTLYRVTQAIVDMQRSFLDKGIRCLRPLTLAEVAAEIGVHESTVSRATADKYVATPRGTYSYRFFFSSGVDSQNGGTSRASIEHMIRDIVAGEDPQNPLSDAALQDMLNKQGIAISRRTVAKYRNQAGIPSSQKRRRFLP